MMKFRENEDAVSPVIGVILMVAITVILAAVIAAFVFGMTDNLTPQKEVYVTTKLGVDTSDEPVMIVTLQGGKDIPTLKKVEALIADGTPDGPTDIQEILKEGDAPFEAGDSGEIELKNYKSTDMGPKSYEITIRGIFTDGTVKVLTTKTHIGPKTTTVQE